MAKAKRKVDEFGNVKFILKLDTYEAGFLNEILYNRVNGYGHWANVNAEIAKKLDEVYDGPKYAFDKLEGTIEIARSKNEIAPAAWPFPEK